MKRRGDQMVTLGGDETVFVSNVCQNKCWDNRCHEKNVFESIGDSVVRELIIGSNFGVNIRQNGGNGFPVSKEAKVKAWRKAKVIYLFWRMQLFCSEFCRQFRTRIKLFQVCSGYFKLMNEKLRSFDENVVNLLSFLKLVFVVLFR